MSTCRYYVMLICRCDWLKFLNLIFFKKGLTPELHPTSTKIPVKLLGWVIKKHFFSIWIAVHPACELRRAYQESFWEKIRPQSYRIFRVQLCYIYNNTYILQVIFEFWSLGQWDTKAPATANSKRSLKYK